jgi:hypothetical protein
LDFRLYPIRFGFVAKDALHLPEGQAGNILRGAFGTILRRQVCAPACTGARSCPARAECAYARLFEPSALDAGPSGLADLPRPFVFRTAHLDGATLAPGDRFHFDFHLFDVRRPALSEVTLALAELANAGLGPGRGRAEIVDTRQWDAATGRWEETARPPMSLSLDPEAALVDRVRIRFVTPTELKSGGSEQARPEFAVLAARIRDRIAALRAFYGDGPLEIDFRGFGERAAQVRMTDCRIQHIGVTRRSSRTGQTHPIGGFVGEAEYEGGLREFLPFLKAAQWTGVGRQTVWGKGEMQLL